MAKRVLVTGAAGFIIGHLCELPVRGGFFVGGFVHHNFQGHWPNLEPVSPEMLRQIEIVPGDIADAGSVSRATVGCEWVFHLAALIGIPYSYLAPASYGQTNVIGPPNV